MAKFTAPVDLRLRLPGGFEVEGAAGATHRIPDSLVEEFTRDQVPGIPGGVTWITQDETSAFADFDPDAKYDVAGGTIAGSATVTGTLGVGGAVALSSTLGVTGLASLASVVAAAVTATTARFRGGPWHDVKAYGAVGDGTTNDAAAIQSAINAAIADSGTIFFPAGTYALGSTTVYFTANGLITGAPRPITMRGAGPRASVITYTGASVAMSSGSTTNTPGGPFIASDITIDGSSSTTGSIGLYLKRYQEASSLTNVRIVGFQTANAYLLRTYGISLNACHFVSSAGWGLILDNANGATLSGGTRCSSNTLGGAKLFYNDGTGAHGEADAGTTMASGSIAGCLFEGNTGPGIRLEDVDSLVITGNYIEGNGTGQIMVTGTSAAPSQNIAIFGNRFNGDSISTHAVSVDHAVDVSIFNNRTLNHTTAAYKVTANGSWNLGPTKSSESTIVTDASTVAGGYFGNVIPFSLAFGIANPAASVTDGDVNFADGSAFLSTHRLLMGGVWEVQSISVRGNATVTTGNITFYPTSISTPKATVSNASGVTVVATGKGQGPSAATALGLRYSTTSDYAPVTADYYIVMSGVVRLI